MYSRDPCLFQTVGSDIKKGHLDKILRLLLWKALHKLNYVRGIVYLEAPLNKDRKVKAQSTVSTATNISVILTESLLTTIHQPFAVWHILCFQLERAGSIIRLSLSLLTATHLSPSSPQLPVFSTNRTEWRRQSPKGQTVRARWSAPHRSTSTHRSV